MLFSYVAWAQSQRAHGNVDCNMAQHTQFACSLRCNTFHIAIADSHRHRVKRGSLACEHMRGGRKKIFTRVYARIWNSKKKKVAIVRWSQTRGAREHQHRRISTFTWGRTICKRGFEDDYNNKMRLAAHASCV